MPQITESIDVDVPVSTAYDQWTQFESFPRFLDEVVSITQKDDTHLHWVVKVGGAEREFDAVITEQHPDERIAWTSTQGDTAHGGVVTFHRLAEDRSRVTVQIDWEPEGFVEHIGALLGAGGHAVRKDLHNFKEFIEKRGTETGAWRGDVEAGSGGQASSTPGDSAAATATGVAPGSTTDPALGIPADAPEDDGLTQPSAGDRGIRDALA